MTDINSFKTRGRANDGIRINLSQPGGAATEHWLQVRSVWSDEYQAMRSELIRQAVESAKRMTEVDADEAKAIRRDTDRRLRADAAASLIAGWSFDIELNFEAASDFLMEAPQILAQVERIAEDDRRFFGKGSANSSTGESQS